MEQIDVFTSAKSFNEEDLRHSTAVVIDVLRASTTIATALYNGADGLIPAADMDEVSKIAQKLDASSYLLCGEKNGVRIEGYDMGNSPLEYTAERVEGKTLIFKTSNGTEAIARARKADQIVIGSFVNLSVVIDYLKACSGNLVLVCAGWGGRLALEDMLCAGQIVYELFDGRLPASARDGAKVAFSLYHTYADRIEQTIRNSNHAVRLREKVDSDDVTYSCQIDSINVLPVLNERLIEAKHDRKANPKK